MIARPFCQPRRLLGGCVVAICCLAVGLAAEPTTAPIEGIPKHTPNWHALTDVRIVTSAGQSIEKGAIVLRNGKIMAVGDHVEIPAGARIWKLTGKTVYPGLIDAYSTQTTERPTTGASYWNDSVHPQISVADQYKSDEALNKTLRSQGITARLVAPHEGIIRGESAIVATGTQPAHRALLADQVALHLTLTLHQRGRDSYPKSPMGAVALARQAFYDARWYRKAWRAFDADNTLPRPERNDSLARLADYLDGSRLAIVDAADEQFVLRADRFAREFGLRIAIRASGREYQRLNAIRKTGRTLIVPVNFPKPPNVATAEAALDASLARLMHWDHAPENPARLVESGVRIALTSHGLKNRGELLAKVREAVERGLSPDDALRALTETPAELLGIDRRLGSIAAGKAAHLVIADGDLFAKKTKIAAVWIDGQHYPLDTPPNADVRGTWRVELDGKKKQPLWIELDGTPKKPQGKIYLNAKDAKPVALDHVELDGDRLAIAFPAKSLGQAGRAQLTVVRSDSDVDQPWLGSLHLPDGSATPATAHPAEELPKNLLEKEKKEKPDADRKPDDQAQESAETDTEDNGKAGPAVSFPVNFPLGAYGRTALPEQPRLVLIKDATVWTCDEAGTIEKGSILFGEGKILDVGEDIAAPEGAVVIDTKGMHITPGIIDCHSHMATDGGINESGQAVTSEVRIGDFIDATDVNIYRQLAGGVTTANILHGSANPIGGQNQVIKLRWGGLPEELKFKRAPAGIKFALGENVKQSNWGDRFTTRYPQTRMGVEQIFRAMFTEAQQYQQRHNAWQANPQGLPPRRDLELDALVEILNHDRWIHCHSYRQDEILALLRALDDFDITIGTLQHILEGYKVADHMASHGAMGSSFADWWAYKFEVYDAIPYNGALMRRAGVVVSFNSDDAELARHLNQEAGKATLFGNVPPEAALKFVTLNPARQLRIDQHVGSLAAGKDADLVLWSGPPLSNLSRCEATWIDGRKYFDRQADIAHRAKMQAQRAALIQKILAAGVEMASPGEEPVEARALWPRHDEFCTHGHHGHDHE